MTFKVDDLAVVTGPLSLEGIVGSVHLEPGEVVRVLDTEEAGIPRVHGQVSDHHQYIDGTSLTLLSEIQDRNDVQWGDLLDPDYVHDYVWDGDYEEDDE